MLAIIYLFSLRCYVLGIRIACLFSPKAAEWIRGRKHWKQKLETALSNTPVHWWMHCASLGEFEQGRPILEELRKRYPEDVILLTFFSPSGYTIRKDTPLADFVSYLPLDTPHNAKCFIKLVRPKVMLFVKYEFWHFFISELKNQGIPLVLVAGLFRKEQVFFRPWGPFFLKMLKKFSFFFLQNDESAQLLHQKGLQNLRITGDPRIDRVANLPQRARSFSHLSSFANNSPVFIVGSAHKEDWRILHPFLAKHLPMNWKVIVAPHEIDSGSLAYFEQQMPGPSQRYTRYQEDSNTRFLLLDTIGMLSEVYQYVDICFIGGGFGKGIHNTLEPMAFGLPVIFGPKFNAFEEATWAVSNQCAFPVNTTIHLTEVFNRLTSDTLELERVRKETKAYMQQNLGAAKRTVDGIIQLLDVKSNA